MAAQWITLGTCGGPFQQAEAYQISNALIVGEAVYLFDVGNGVLRRLAQLGIATDRIRGVFVTHHHPDHIADLGLIMLTHWQSPGDRTIEVCGPRGTVDLVDGLAAAYRTAELLEPADKPRVADRVRAVDAADAGSDGLTALYRDELISVEAIEVAHFRAVDGTRSPGQALGLRVIADGRVIAYTGDTGDTPSLEVLACDADLLVAEVVDVARIMDDLRVRFAAAPASVVERVEYNMRNNHLSPEQVGRVASTSAVQQVVLTHYVPCADAAQSERLAAAVAAVAEPIPVHAAQDLTVH